MKDRSSSLGAAAGTTASKGLAFLRNIVLAAAIGTGAVGDSFALANNLPNMVFLLIGGGAIATIFVPQIARLRAKSVELSDQYSSFLLLIVGTVCALVVGVLMLANPVLMALYGAGAWSEGQLELTSSFALWCLPLILLASLSAIQAQVLNARRYFAAAAWAPIVVPLPIILAGVVIALDPSTRIDAPGEFLGWQRALLGASVLIGGGLQVVWLAVAGRRAGYRFTLPRALSGLGLKSTARLGGWALASTGIFAAGSIVLAVLLTRAGAEASSEGYVGRGYAAFLLAQVVVLFVNSVAISAIGNPHIVAVAERSISSNLQSVQRTVRDALARISALMIPGSLCIVIVAVSVWLGAFRGFGDERGDVQAIGLTLALLAIGLPQSTTHMIMIRTFYALKLGRPPLWSSLRINLISVALPVALSVYLPAPLMMWVAALAWSVAYWIDAPIKGASLRRHMGAEATRGVGFLAVGLWFRGLVAATAAMIVTVVLIRIRANAAVSLVSIGIGVTVFLVLYTALTWRSEHGVRAIIRALAR